MGWTSFDKHYCITNKRGQVDKKATMTHELESWGTEVVKAAMAGGNYYAVVRTDKGVPFLAVILTEVRGNEFFYKELVDTMGPYVCSCPKSILDLADELCPCTDEYDTTGFAKEWRAKCRLNLAKKNLPTTFSNVKPGDWIEWHVPEDSTIKANGVSIAGCTINLTKVHGRRSWITYDFFNAMRVPIKFVNPADCTLKA